MCSRLLILGGVLTILVASCGGEDGDEIVCPMHLDPISRPSMEIQTLDGSFSIAAVDVVQGPCRVIPGQLPVDAAARNHTVTIERYTPMLDSGYAAGTSDPCTIRVVSRKGQCVTVTATMVWYEAGSSRLHCSDNSNCCPRSRADPFKFQRWEFAQRVIPISFGDEICAGYDAGVVNTGALDGGAVDSAID